MENKKIIEYLQNNVDTLRDMVQDCNSWNGSLDWYCYYENNEDFFEMFFEGKPTEAVRAVCYGDYNFMDGYVQFNGYGNLESKNEWEVEEELKGSAEEIFNTWYELYQNNNVDTWDDNLKELLEEKENDED